MAKKKLALTAIKADVGSEGGHTKPSDEMMKFCQDEIESAKGNTIIDGRVTHTGDDICLLMSHLPGMSKKIHDFAWRTLDGAGDIAIKQALYGAKQDLVSDAPSGNVRGAGPGVAALSFSTDDLKRPAEAIMVITGDKCGPGIFNFLLTNVFANPRFCAGLMLPNMLPGFTFTIVDMDYTEGDRVIRLNGKTHWPEIAFLMRDDSRFGIKTIHSNMYPDQQVVDASTQRLQNVFGVYKGKDDPVAIVRTQGIFPAPEEVVSPFEIVPYVSGDARGSHHMPLMPMPINSPVTGTYCLPIVSAVAYSITKDGTLTPGHDMFSFESGAWDEARRKAQLKGMYMREQGWYGAAMLNISELEYSPFRDVLAMLEKQFKVE